MGLDLLNSGMTSVLAAIIHSHAKGLEINWLILNFLLS
jgi:hypothetical protein